MPPMSSQQIPQQQPAPQEIKQSYMLWLVAIGFAVIGLIISVVSLAGTTTVSGTGVSGGASSVQVGGAAVAVTDAVVGVILFGVWYLFVHKMREGRQWARITLLVIGILAFLSFLSSLALQGGAAAAGFSVAGGGSNVASIIVGVLEWLAVIGAVIMMFRPSANAYFRSPVTYA
jgi:uncharacterized membrane protein